MKKVLTYLVAAISTIAFISCGGTNPQQPAADEEAPSFLKLVPSMDGGPYAVSISPADCSADTLYVSGKMTRIVCMSSSYAACVDALGEDEAVVGISGARYLSNDNIRAHAHEVGFDGAVDFEQILNLRPDILVASSTDGRRPEYADRLEDLGVRTFVLYDNFEQHPLSRAAYVKFFGMVTDNSAKADSIYSAVSEKYMALAAKVAEKIAADGSGSKRPSVLMNLPYQDQWFIPGGRSYMAKLIQDAGGTVAGADPDSEKSSVITVEKAFELSADADYWLNPGMCTDKVQIRAQNPLFNDFPVLSKSVYNNNAKVNPRGGNDFWESGALRPDLILEDLVRIFNPGLLPEAPLHYYIEVED